MKTCFVVSIDVEEDSPNWRPEYPYSLKNILEIPNLQKLFDKFNVKPTYLLTYSVANDKKCIEIFKKIYNDGKCEIGTHLHPWTNPPIKDDERLVATLPCDLSDDLLSEKFKILTEKIYESFNIKPKSYRAGRYGIDKRSIDLLEKYGYLVDTSVTPHQAWKCNNDELSFINAPHAPYFIDKNDLISKGDSSILEVPVSIIRSKKYFFSKFSPMWLRPSYSTVTQMKKVVDYFIANEFPILNMMFHSNEIAVGQSIFSKNSKQVKKYYSKLQDIFSYIINEKKITSKTLIEVKSEYKF